MSLWQVYVLAVVLLPSIWIVAQIGTSIYSSYPSSELLDGSGFIRLYGSAPTVAADAYIESGVLKQDQFENNGSAHFVKDDLLQLLFETLKSLSKGSASSNRTIDPNATTEDRLLQVVHEINLALNKNLLAFKSKSWRRRNQRQDFRPFRKKHSNSHTGVNHVLILSKSAPLYKHRRYQMRSSWIDYACKQSRSLSSNAPCSPGNVCLYRNITWSNRFLVGMTSGQGAAMESLADEVLLRRDFLLSPHVDQYDKITWKIMWALSWTSQYLDYSYLMFVDDDCYLQFPPLFRFLNRAPRSKLYAGRVPYTYAIVVRNATNKWFVDKRVFGGQFFPTYVWGACLIMSEDVVHLTTHAAQAWRPWLGIDDAFIGLLVHAMGIKVTDVRNIHADEYQYKGCNRYDERQEPLLVVATSDVHLNLLDRAARRNDSLCPYVFSKKRFKDRRVVTVVLLLLCTVMLFGFVYYFLKPTTTAKVPT